MRFSFGPVLLFAGVTFTGPAIASGGLSCEIDSTAIKLELQSGITRGMGSPLFQFQGQLALTDTKVPEDLRNTEFTDEHVAQYWLDGKVLNLVLYRERPAEKPHGYVELTMQTKASGDEGTYAGKVEISVFDGSDEASSEGLTIKKNGKVSCFVE